jgi:branched-chain amino acid transport system permease protein
MTSSPAPAGASEMAPRAVLIECGITALIVFALALPLAGVRIADIPGGLELQPHLDRVVAATIIAFLGRFALVLLRHGRNLPVAVSCGLVALAWPAILLIDWLTAGDGQPGLWDSLAPNLPINEPAVLTILTLLAAFFAGKAIWRLAFGDGTGAAAQPLQQLAGHRHLARYLGFILLAMAIILPMLPWADRRLLDVAILVGAYIMLGWGLNIVVGLAGLLDLGYVAFYAVGAYSYALLAQYFGLGFWICLPFAGIMAAFAGVLLGFPVLRLRGDYLAIVTLGFGEIIRVVLLNWYDFTGGPDGISNIPRPTLFGLEFARNGEATFHEFFGLEYSPIQRIIFLYYLVLLLALAVNVFTQRMRRLPAGRAWEALREDEIACRALGINPRNVKLTAFGIGAMFGGFSGAFFATRQGFISPESFTFIESAVILAIVVLGGFGSQLGVVFAAILLVGLPEFFRELQEYRMLAFGFAMVAIMVWRPGGLLATREPTLLLGPQPPPDQRAGGGAPAGAIP